ncbi:MAG: carbon storage regulator [Planctomycetota bacterium]
MLVLSRKEGESLQIGDDVVLTVSRISSNRVAIAIDAPKSVQVKRSELPDKVEPPSSDDD